MVQENFETIDGERHFCCCQEATRLNTVLFQKWKKDLDREFLTVSWLDYTCEKVKGNTVVSKLKCKVCGEFEDRIKGRKNSAINGLLEQIQLG